MRKMVVVLLFVVFVASSSFAFATADGLHQSLACTSCHVNQPVDGQPVDFIGDKENLCSGCHGKSATAAAPAMAAMTVETVQAAAIVNAHSSYGTIPESMKQNMIEWLKQKGLPLIGDPTSAWSMGCTTCHKMHGAPYAMLLSYDMKNGELCQLCHGGTANSVTEWTNAASRRVLYSPSNSGQLQVDGITEISVPTAPKSGDVVTSTVNFPLTVIAGIHKTQSTADIGYKISIPGSVFGTKDINPANHLYWYFGQDMVTWDTTLEQNGPYDIIITPYTPSTLVDATPVTLSVEVKNLTLADKICTTEGKIRTATIDNEGIRNSLVSKANNACSAAQRGNMNAARGLLEALINQVEAQKGKHVATNSADELIKSVNLLLLQF